MKFDSLDDIYVVSERLVPVSREQIDRARAALKTDFPCGYDEFMLRFGKGDFSGYLRPHDPDRILDGLVSNREWLGHNYWDAKDSGFPSGAGANLVLFADTIDSDAFAFLPGKPEVIYVFPRHESRIYRVGRSFLELLNWVANSGIVVQAFERGFFQPWNDFASIRIHNPHRTLSCSEMTTLFQRIGAADHLIVGREVELIDYFIRRYGAHLNYLVMRDYVQFIIHFDSASAAEFSALLSRSLKGHGFRITEHANITHLPNLS